MLGILGIRDSPEALGIVEPTPDGANVCEEDVVSKSSEKFSVGIWVMTLVVGATLIEGLMEGQIVVGDPVTGGSVGTPQEAVHTDFSLQYVSPTPQKFCIERHCSRSGQGSPPHVDNVGISVGNCVVGGSEGTNSGDIVTFTNGCIVIVGDTVGIGLSVGDRVPENGAMDGFNVGASDLASFTPRQFACAKHSSPSGHSV